MHLILLLTIRSSSLPECGDGLWYRVAYLNMTDPSQQCPPAWREYNTSGVRACGRPVSNVINGTCPSMFYSTNRQYSRVCGRVIGFQVGSPDGFNPTHDSQLTMDGVIIGHGASHHHIWSYIAGATDRSSFHRQSNCPCSSTAGVTPNAMQSQMIADNYYCESGNPTNSFPNNIIYSIQVIPSGMASSVKVPAAVVPSLPHGSVYSCLPKQPIELR